MDPTADTLLVLYEAGIITGTQLDEARRALSERREREYVRYLKQLDDNTRRYEALPWWKRLFKDRLRYRLHGRDPRLQAPRPR